MAKSKSNPRVLIAAVVVAIGLGALAAAGGNLGPFTPTVVAPPMGFEAELKATAAYCQTLVGLPEADAQSRAEADGYRWRVVKRDGEGLPVTADLITNRIDAEIDNGKLVACTAG